MSTTRKYTFDIDTKRYINRVNSYRLINGLPDIANSDAVDIDNFIIGLKDLGVWHNVIFWPMRSQHNIGIGNTVLSLGGAGICSGTIIGTLTWSTSGINKAAGVSGYIQVNNFPLVEGDMSAFSDTLVSTYVVNQFFSPIEASASSFNGKGRMNIFYFGNVNAGVLDAELTNDKRTLHIATPTTNSRQWLSGSTRYNLTTFNGLFNSTFVEGSPTSSGTGSLPHITNSKVIYAMIGQSVNYVYTGGMVGLANTYLTGTQHSSVKNLYKETIGKGLGLP